MGKYLGVGQVPEEQGDLYQQVRALRDHIRQLQQGLELTIEELERKLEQLRLEAGA